MPPFASYARTLNLFDSFFGASKTANSILPEAARTNRLSSNRFYANDDASHLHKVAARKKVLVMAWGANKVAAEEIISRRDDQTDKLFIFTAPELENEFEHYEIFLEVCLLGDDATMASFSGLEVK